MKNVKRTLVALLLLFSLCLSACSLSDLPFFGKDPGNDTPDNPVPIDAVIVPEDEILTRYYVVYTSSPIMAQFVPEMMNIYGLEPYCYQDTEHAETRYEILLGNTNRALSAELMAAVNALADEEGGLTWGYACRGGQLAIYATSAKAFDGSTSWDYCITNLKRAYMRANSFIVEDGTWDIQNLSAAALAVKEAEAIEAQYVQNAKEIAQLQKTINQNMGKVTSNAVTQRNYKNNFGTVLNVSTNVKATPTAYPAANTHPRLGLNTSRVAELNTEITSGTQTLKLYQYGEDNQVYRALVKMTDDSKTQSATFGTLDDPASKTDNNNFSALLLDYIEACAFRYALEHEEGNNRDAATIYGYRAINGLINYLKTIDVGDYSLKYRTAGEVMFIAAEVYDWCYDLLTDDMKTNIISAVTSKMAPELEITKSSTDITPSNQGPFAGHGAEAQLLRDWLAFSIAVYDEYPEYYNYVAGRITADYVPYRNAYYQGETQGQGNSYGIYRFNFEVDSALFYEAMQCTDDPIPLYDFSIEKVALGFVYNTRPDSQLLHIGDDINERNAVGSTNPQYLMNDYARTLFYASAYTGNSVLKAESYRYLNGFSTFTNNDNFLTRTQFLIYNDPTLDRTSKSTLPLTHYFDSPSGILITRNAWNSDAAMVYMKIGERYTGGHEHADGGSFQIYYHGMLAIDAGFYDNYGSRVHSHNKSTLAHNALLIDGTGQDNSGGEPKTFETMQSGGTVIGEAVLEDENGQPLYAYLAGDITDNYYNAGAKEVGRYMLAVYNYDEDGNPTDTPLCFFVFDDVKTKVSKTTSYLLQPMTEPTISGNVVTIVNDLYIQNVWDSYQADGVLVDQAFSDSGEITIVGLEGRYGTENPKTDGRWREDINTLEAGWGRVEIQVTGTETKMLNVIYVTDTATNDEQGLLEAVMYGNADILGASVPALGVASFFNKNVEKIDAATVRGEGNGDIRYAVCGLSAGTYTVKNASSATVATVNVTEESGMLTFTAPAGTYTISK